MATTSTATRTAIRDPDALRDSGVQLSRSDRTLVCDFLSEELNHNKEGTVRKKLSDIRLFSAWIGDMALTDVSPRDFKRFITESLNEDLAPATVYSRYNSVKSLYAWLANEGEPVPSTIAKRITKNQHKAMRDRGRKETEAPFDFYLDPEGTESVETLVEHVPAPKVRNQLIIRLMFACGFRRGEIATLTLDRLGLEERSATVDNLKAGDNQPLYRTNWFRRDVEVLARAWLRSGRPAVYNSGESPYVFPTVHSDHITANQIGEIVKQAAENAGIQSVLYTDSGGSNRYKITAHTLRHSYAVYCIKEGMDVKTLKDLMGHASLDVTMQYLRFREEDHRTAARRYGP